MYCSSCGLAVAPNLTYRNHCGAKLGADKSENLIKTTELRQESMVMSAMVGLFVLGLVAISILLGVMKAVLQFNVGPLVLLQKEMSCRGESATFSDDARGGN